MINKYILLLLFLNYSYANDKPVEFVIGVESIPFLPYSNVENGKYLGVFKEILEKFSKKEKIKFKFLPLPISRLYADFYNQKIDFKIPSNPYWQKSIKEKRKLNIKYSDPIVDYIDGVMVKKKGMKLDSIKTLGVVLGFTPWEYIKRIEQKIINTRENPSIDGLLQQGILGRIDGAYVNIAVAQHYLRNSLKKSNQLVFDSTLPHTKSNYYMATIKHPSIIDKFNTFLKENHQILSNIRKTLILE